MPGHNYYHRELITTGILNRDNEVIRWLYMRVYGHLEMFILSRNGTAWDVMDVFQDGLLKLYEKVLDSSLVLEKNVPEYLFGICKHLWYKQYRRSNLLVSVPDYKTENILYYEESDFPVFSDRRELKYILFLRHITSLCPLCQQLLTLYRNGMRADDIVQEMELASRSLVYKKKFTCMRRLVKHIQNDPDFIYL